MTGTLPTTSKQRKYVKVMELATFMSETWLREMKLIKCCASPWRIQTRRLGGSQIGGAKTLNTPRSL